MMQKWYPAIDEWMEGHKEELVRDIARLVRIASISGEGSEGAPFGRECRAALEEMLLIGQEHGFHTENYEYYVGSIGEKEKNWENTIGFWNHLDVVPVGNDWQYEPFCPKVREHFLIGRGAQDNKGPAVGMLYVMQCLRELGIPLKHELCLFVGCDEEKGMADLDYYTAHYPCPALSMIADSGFPVCYGEKGILEGKLIFSRRLSEEILECGGGSASNMIPDKAYVTLRRREGLLEEVRARMKRGGKIALREEEDRLVLVAKGTSRHSAFPEGSCNAIHVLAGFLKDLSGLADVDREQFAALERISEEYYGVNLGIDFADEVSGSTTCAATVLEVENGQLALTLNIRYAVTESAGRLGRCLDEAASRLGCAWRQERDSAPSYFPKEHPAVERLTGLYNALTGEKAKSFVMGGGTYARRLPNAFAYGLGGLRENEADIRAKKRLFLPGHGGAHEPDEGLNLRFFIFFLTILFFTHIINQ